MEQNKFTVENLQKLFEKSKPQSLEDYFKFLKFPSISSEPEHAKNIQECFDWLSDYLKTAGFDVQKWPTPGHPTLFASYLKAGPNKPTLLIYNHYDVQPVDPLEAWTTPPFEPTIRNGQVFARGAQDNKGQCFYTILALKSLLERDGTLPVNIKLCIEGEEECGSMGLSKILNEKKEWLQADYVAVVDLGIPSKDCPAITLGLRGLVTMDVEVQGSLTDLHSGIHGGKAFNPIHALVNILDSLRDVSGKIRVPGFYDDVLPLSFDEKALLSLDFDEKEYEKTFGILPTGGEQEFSVLERAWVRPTLEINGIAGGYSGDGFKTVIPARASAKISCRLVPNQDPLKIGKLVTDYIKKLAPNGVKVKTHIHPGKGAAIRTDIDAPIVQAFAQAYTELFGTPCKFIFEGASIPIIPELAVASGGKPVLVGLGYPDDQIHAPNEHFGIDRLEQGFILISKALYNLSTTRRSNK